MVNVNTRNTSSQQLSVGDEVKKLKRTIQALSLGFGGVVFILVGVLAIVSTQPAEGSPSPGTCLPIDKGGTNCDEAEFKNEFSTPYSTTEQLTGETWIDGKPIYRKAWEGSVGTVAASTIHWVTLANDVDAVVSYGGWFHTEPGVPHAIPMARPGNILYAYVRKDTNNNSNLYLYTFSYLARTASCRYQVWVEYTKS